MHDTNNLWNIVLEKLELSLSNVSYSMWFKDSKVIDLADDVLFISAKSTFAKNQILKNYFDKLKSAVDDIFGENIEIEILDPDEEVKYVAKNKPAETKDIEPVKNPLNPKFTFNNFVVGKSNQTAYAASKAVAENPGKTFNPLFLYGGVGLGKTHLLHAIGNYIKQNSPKLEIRYVTCEQFTNDYIESLGSTGKNKTYQEFRDKYRNCDVLMVDDIQFISKKTSTQEEFFNTFNDLIQYGKQIIIASDRHPKEIPTLEERLRSRLLQGLTQDLTPPDFETRVAILRKKCQIEKYSISDDAIEYIAEKIDSNVRELEGMLSKVCFLSNLIGKTSADLSDVKEAFSDKYEEKNEGGANTDQIISAVCEYFGISRDDIVGKKKSKEIVEPRMIAIYMISEMLELPLVSIGKIFGGRDHTTIMHSRDKISDEMKTNRKTQTIVSEIKKMLTSG